MADIKAFVGHSFTQDDETVVASFLKVFDQIKGVLPSFDWTHARQAEPEELAKKVLRLVADCNTFIAICTKKELVTRPEAITPRIFSSDSSTIKNDQLEWKTSDWIIQEIGLAAGRPMSLVILLEEGCRRPGGLQGDVEFIPFDRSAPEKAFGPILEMLKAINPPTGSRVESTPDGESETDPTNSPEETASQSVDNDTPKDDWTIDKYESAFFWNIITRKAEKADEISQAFHASELATSSELRAEWDAKCEEWRLRFTDKGSLSLLKTLHDKFPENLGIKTAYASGLSFYSKHEESADLYNEASGSSTEPSQIVANKIQAALERAKAGQRELAENLINEARYLARADSNLEYQLAYGIMSYADQIKDTELRIEAMERIIWLKPDDDEIRFSLAYTHSESGNNDMALHHYLAIPHSRRKSHTWNNLGVAYQSFSVPARSIMAFEKAATDGNTLAMSNLAYRYINVGFVRQAREQLDKALAEEDPHKNVNEAYALLSEIGEKETKTVNEVLESTAKKIDTFKKLGAAICEPNTLALEGEWVGPDCDFFVAVNGRQFEARGRYEVKSTNALSGLLGSVKSEYEIVLKGEIGGRRVFGDVERKSLNPATTSLLGDAQIKKRFAILLDEDLQGAEVIESINNRSPTFYRIHVKAKTAGPEAGE